MFVKCRRLPLKRITLKIVERCSVSSYLLCKNLFKVNNKEMRITPRVFVGILSLQYMNRGLSTSFYPGIKNSKFKIKVKNAEW